MLGMFAVMHNPSSKPNLRATMSGQANDEVDGLDRKGGSTRPPVRVSPPPPREGTVPAKDRLAVISNVAGGGPKTTRTSLMIGRHLGTVSTMPDARAARFRP
jgi:hypothetical protein